MTEKDLDEFEKEFGFKLLPTSFKKPLFGDKRGKTRWTVFMKEKRK